MFTTGVAESLDGLTKIAKPIYTDAQIHIRSLQGESKMCHIVKVTICCMGMAIIAWAADPFVGTWKLNIDKSKSGSGRPLPESSQSIEATADGYRILFSGASQALVLNVDGRDHATEREGIAGTTNADTRTVRRVSPVLIETTMKQGGKTVAVVRRQVSEDGRTLTTTTNGVNSKGEKYQNILIYDKQ